MELYGISPLAIAGAAGVSVRTATRWKRDGIPASMQRAVALSIFGDLGELDTQWLGWKLWRGSLWSPEGTSFQPGEVRAIPYRVAQLQELQHTLSRPAQLSLL